MASRTRRIIQISLAVAIAVPTALAARFAYRHFRGIEVCVHNVDSEPLRAGQVAVTSSTAKKLYAIGDLAPNHKACVWIRPEGEADVSVTFATATGRSKPIVLDGYVESDNYGSIAADVTADGARGIKRDITIY